jgi:hypothetical protein
MPPPGIDVPSPTIVDEPTSRPEPIPLPTDEWPALPNTVPSVGQPKPEPVPTEAETEPVPTEDLAPTVTQPLPAVPGTGGPMTTAPLPSMTPTPPSTGDGVTAPDASGAAGMPCNPDVCFEQASNAALALSQPRAEPSPYTEAACEPAPACSCSGGGSDGSVEVSLLVGAAECVAAGRFGECLFESSEYAGCSVEGSECSEACALLSTRQREEAASAPSVSVAASACGNDGQCRFVLQSDLGCVSGAGFVPTDCASASATVTGP